ncbi:uncharacterized protein B0T15DRAFT_533121 [Chaetomium strumarium]|uniref:Secreted protein n=1 Tax=Chaetomium strumarium TaxID=1170767 RepID=A0AAJ0M1P2_9PEZI|nr:hypothetical protein B0T15DRAFT_533121 [Chaetomium strumarium]
MVRQLPAPILVLLLRVAVVGLKADDELCLITAGEESVRRDIDLSSVAPTRELSIALTMFGFPLQLVASKFLLTTTSLTSYG